MPGVGLFLFGNAKNKTIDNRQLFVALESATAAHVVGVNPDLEHAAREFAARVNLAAKQLKASES